MITATLWMASALLSCGASEIGPKTATLTGEGNGEGDRKMSSSGAPGNGVGGDRSGSGGGSKPPAKARWELADSLSTFRKAAPRARSAHGGGDLEGEVLANAEAKAYPALGPARLLPPGAVLVEAHYRAGSSEPVFFFVMAKRPAGFDNEGRDWEYLIVEPQGVVSERGRLPLCARCHAEAPNDNVFGPPR